MTPLSTPRGLVSLDGRSGEGGGQVLRTALGLSLATMIPFRIDHIRAGRTKPGLLRQHLTAVSAAQAIGDAELTGAELGSTALTFTPRRRVGGQHRFAIGTAGSAILVLHAVLPGLLACPGEHTLTLEGGTDNPAAPPFDHLERVYAPLVGRLGGALDVRLERRGFFPVGGGRFVATTRGAALRPVDYTDRGVVRRVSAFARIGGDVSQAVAKRELAVLKSALPLDGARVDHCDSLGPGNSVEVHVEMDHGAEVFVGFGERGVSAEAVAERVAEETRTFLASRAAVSEHTADQLVLLLALAGGGRFTSMPPTSRHLETQALVIPHFLGVRVAISRAPDLWEVAVLPA